MGEFTNELQQRLLLGPRVSSSQKLSDPDAGGVAARGGVCLMQNKNLALLITTEPPTIAI
jgi:hypothetical protein